MSAAVLVAAAATAAVWASATGRAVWLPVGPPPTGTAILSSHPGGAVVTVDGTPRGTTPIVLQLSPGPHAIEVAGADAGVPPERISADIVAGAEWRRHVTLAIPIATPALGALRVESPQAGAELRIDGTVAGVTPFTATLTPGEHVVQVRSASSVATRTVTVVAGASAALVFGVDTPQAPLSGWISIDAPFELQVQEGGQLLGVSRSERIMVGAGRHQFNLVNDALGFQQQMAVTVPAGRTARLSVDHPTAGLSVNALPWATVTIDGRPYGDTPVANVALPIGAHTVTLRHPTLGERTETVTVRLSALNRVSVDLRPRP
ncbi:MAG: PEGA domain-containing protein [Acidobacteriota bacterium]